MPDRGPASGSLPGRPALLAASVPAVLAGAHLPTAALAREPG
jgi:hypothetical protein